MRRVQLIPSRPASRITLPIITTVSLPVATQGAAYTMTLAAIGGSPNYTWSITGALDAGLTLNTSSGVISGVPSNPSTTNLTVTVTDSLGKQGVKVFALTIVASNAPAITTASPLPTATVGIAYSVTLTASGGTLPYIWSYTGALTTGLILNTVGGIISGTATAAVSSTLTMKVTDNVGNSSTKVLSLPVVAATTLAFSTTSLPAGTVGVAYSAQLVATGGTSPYSFAYVSTTVPGLTVSAAGLISGTPSGVFSGTVGFKVTDAVAATATFNWPFVVNATAGVGFDGVLRVASGKLVNGSGGVLQLKGASIQGLDSSAVQGQQLWYGNLPDWTTYKTWKPNVARIPLNAASFLALNCLPVNATGNGWTTTVLANADPFGAYVAGVDAAIAAAQAIGCYVILDLHWSAPKFTFAGTTAYLMPLSQSAFMNTDTDLAFWQAIATRYGTQAAPQAGINNNGIAFELFNEPFIDQMSGFANNATTWTLMKSGGACNLFSTNFRTTAIAQNWTVLGYQTVLNAVRTIGANNVCIINGTGYANASAAFASWMPTDAANPAQLVVGQHTYPHGTYPYSNGDVYPNCYPDPNTGTVNWDAGVTAVTAAGIPLAITEDGGSYGPNASGGEPHVSYMVGWADSHKISYIPWNYWPPAVVGASGSNYLVDTAKNPTIGQGVVTFNWMSGSTPITVPGQPTSVVATSGNGQATVTFTAPSTGGSPITSYLLRQYIGGVATGVGWSGSASPIIATSLTPGAITQFVVHAINAIGAGADSAASNTITIGSGTGAPAAPTNVRLILQGQNSVSSTPSPPTPSNPNRQDISWTAAAAGANPVASYKIYRSVNGGSFSLYGTAAGTTFSDTAATLCVSGTAGSTAPFYAANTYLYQVSAVDSVGVEGAQSTSQKFYIYQNGTFNWGGDFNFGQITANYNDTTGSPQGGVGDLLISFTSAYSGWLPYSGNLMTQWNMWVGPFNYIYLDLKPSVANQAWQIIALRVGDVSITSPPGTNHSITAYGPAPQVGVWATYKIPLTVLLNDVVNGVTVLENAFYKFTVQDQTGLATNQWWVDNVYLSPT